MRVWQGLQDFDIKPAKPIVGELLALANEEIAKWNFSKASYILEKILANNKKNYDALLALGIGFFCALLSKCSMTAQLGFSL